MSTVTKRESVKPAARTQPELRRQAVSYHHGKTPAGWFGSMVVLLGFFVGLVGFLLPALPNPAQFGSIPTTLIVIGGSLLVVGVIGTVALRALGYGQGDGARH